MYNLSHKSHEGAKPSASFMPKKEYRIICNYKEMNLNLFPTYYNLSNGEKQHECNQHQYAACINATNIRIQHVLMQLTPECSVYYPKSGILEVSTEKQLSGNLFYDCSVQIQLDNKANYNIQILDLKFAVKKRKTYMHSCS